MNHLVNVNIKRYAPLALAGFALYSQYKSNPKDYKKLLIVGAISYAVALILITLVLKSIAEIKKPPAKIDVPDDGVGIGGGTTPKINIKSLTDELKNDIYCIFCFRNQEIYKKLNALSNSDLIAVWNDWNSRYYSLDNETMIQAMEAENYGWGLPGNPAPTNVKNIINRLKTMGAY